MGLMGVMGLVGVMGNAISPLCLEQGTPKIWVACGVLCERKIVLTLRIDNPA